MKARFVGQPLIAHGGWAASLLEDLLADQSFSRLDVAVAWAKRSGLSRLETPIRAFRERGSTASLIVGIDEGGATFQGLELAMELFDPVFVFHDPGRPKRTFHPKVYLFQGERAAVLLVGSNNATAGGLFSNYEATLTCELHLASRGDRELFEAMRSWFDALYSDADVCRPLNAPLLKALMADPKYGIQDEDRQRKRPAHEEDYEGVTADEPGASIFGASKTAKAGQAPVRPRTSRVIPAKRGARRVAVRGVRVTDRWWKQLTASDAQRTKPGSNPTGKIHLTKASHDIDHTTYFRRDFFSGVRWQSQPQRRGTKELATVDFDVTISGNDYGRYPLVVDHADYRVAEQRNAPTWLHWGPLGPILRQQDLTGAWVVLERRDDGSFGLQVTRTTPTPST